MQLIVKTLYGKTYIVNIDSIHTVLYLKYKIEEVSETPVDIQQISYMGLKLDDTLPLSTYDLKNNDILHMILKLRGD